MRVGLLVAYSYCISLFTIAALKGNAFWMIFLSAVIGILAAFIAKD